MGEIELDTLNKQINIYSEFCFYGTCITPQIASDIVSEISEMWNEPYSGILLQNDTYFVNFILSYSIEDNITKEQIYSNTNLRKNYIRIEEFSKMEISFVDNILSNTGYFIIKNIEKGSTTSAHEFGHMLGLRHPANMDIRGKGRPSIMYPRGTLVDAQYQWVNTAQAGAPGGTMNPYHRRVSTLDILDLQLDKIINAGSNFIGGFTNMYHEKFIPTIV